MPDRAAQNVVEQVARSIYAVQAGRVPWEATDENTRKLFRTDARAAIAGHYAAHETPYVDEEHQGGNLLELFLKTFAENAGLKALTSRPGLTAQQVEEILSALEKLRNEQLDRGPDGECDCEDSGVGCHAAAAQFAYLRAHRMIRKAAGLITDPPAPPSTDSTLF